MTAEAIEGAEERPSSGFFAWPNILRGAIAAPTLLSAIFFLLFQGPPGWIQPKLAALFHSFHEWLTWLGGLIGIPLLSLLHLEFSDNGKAILAINLIFAGVLSSAYLVWLFDKQASAFYRVFCAFSVGCYSAVAALLAYSSDHESDTLYSTVYVLVLPLMALLAASGLVGAVFRSDWNSWSTRTWRASLTWVLIFVALIFAINFALGLQGGT